jgi:Ca2+-binding RTX toxin-like protein
MQYDAAITASAFTTALAATSLNATTKSVIADILDLDVSNSTVTAAGYNGKSLSLTVDPVTGALQTPEFVSLDVAGAANTNVTIPVGPTLANASVFLINSEANITFTVGNTVTTQATVDASGIARAIISGSGNDNITVTDNVNTLVDAGAGNDTVTTAGGNDVVILNGGINTVSTGAGDDLVFTGNGSDTVNGGAGFDVVKVSGNLADYVVTSTSNSLVLTGATGTVTLSNVQFVTDAAGVNSIAIASSQAEATALRLYEGLLNRDADATGTQTWTGALAGNGGDLKAIANGFLNSAEYTSQGTLSDAQYIQSLYTNTLDRNADAEGLVHWAQMLATGSTRADVAIGIVGSTEAQIHDTGVIVITGQV